MANNNRHNKKLLILTGSLPPSIGISAIRMNHIIKYLYNDGWEIHVVTSDRSKINYDEKNILSKIHIYKIHGEKKSNVSPSKNTTTIQNVNSKTSIMSTFTKFFKKKLKEIFRVLYMQFTIIKGYRIAKNVLKSNDIDIVYCTVPYITLACVGAKLKKNFNNIKLVEEIRDIISGNEIMEDQQSSLERKVIRSSEKKVLAKVDDFIFLTRNIKQYYCDHYKFNKNLVNGAVITNSYDPDDFDFNSDDEVLACTSELITFSHVGSFYGSRNPINLVKALGELILEHPEYKEKVILQFVGSISDEVISNVNELIKKYNLVNNIKMVGKVPYKDAVNILKNSDVNVLITHETGSAYAIPGKLFDYIAAKRPVLALTNDILVKEIIEEEKLGHICSNTDIPNIKTALNEFITNPHNLEVQPKTSEKYSICNTIKQMQGVFLRGISLIITLNFLQSIMSATDNFM